MPSYFNIARLTAVTLLLAAGMASLLLLGSPAVPAAQARQPPISDDPARCELSALDKFAGGRAGC